MKLVRSEIKGQKTPRVLPPPRDNNFIFDILTLVISGEEKSSWKASFSSDGESWL